MNGKFDISNTPKPTNQDVNIVFTPSLNVTSYTYQIYKDNVLIENNLVQNNQNTVLNLKETGIYQISIQLTLLDGSVDIINSGEYIIDKEAPKIDIKNENIETTPLNNEKITSCTATDNYDKNINDKITDNLNELTLNKIGKYTYTCTVQDEAGNITTKTTNISVVPHNTTIYLIQIICVIIIVLLIIRVLKLFKVVKLEERLEPYVIKPLKNNTLSTSEKLTKLYKEFLNAISNKLKKSVVATKYAKKLDKYTVVTKTHKTGFDILSGKIIFAALFTIMAVIIKAFQFKLLSPLETLGTFSIGFFILDLYLFAKYKVFRINLESDFIAAITIMNNSFKSGRSITQAIEIVGSEVGGTIGGEFKRMNLELTYGLDIGEVFKRFSERIDLEEAAYLTASLTILNKTGGDIIKVFTSIERNLYDKRKLRLELKSLTSGSRIIVYVLLGIPFLFALIISLINKDYFLPFITTDIGRILLIFMIIYYIIFVVVVRKIMKVVV